MEFNIYRAMDTLAVKRPVFHSEADFQFALSMIIKELYPDIEIRLEYLVPGLKYYLDILLKFRNGFNIPIELKYKTLKTHFNINDETFELKNHGAQDIGCYDIVKDIMRIEHITDKMKCKAGYAITLTNDYAYWTPPKNTTIADDFLLTDGAILTGSLGWANNAGVGSTMGREERLDLKLKYPLNWKDYSVLNENKKGKFRYLLTECRR